MNDLGWFDLSDGEYEDFVRNPPAGSDCSMNLDDFREAEEFTADIQRGTRRIRHRAEVLDDESLNFVLREFKKSRRRAPSLVKNGGELRENIPSSSSTCRKRVRSPSDALRHHSTKVARNLQQPEKEHQRFRGSPTSSQFFVVSTPPPPAPTAVTSSPSLEEKEDDFCAHDLNRVIIEDMGSYRTVDRSSSRASTPSSGGSGRFEEAEEWLSQTFSRRTLKYSSATSSDDDSSSENLPQENFAKRSRRRKRRDSEQGPPAVSPFVIPLERADDRPALEVTSESSCTPSGGEESISPGRRMSSGDSCDGLMTTPTSETIISPSAQHIASPESIATDKQGVVEELALRCLPPPLKLRASSSVDSAVSLRSSRRRADSLSYALPIERASSPFGGSRPYPHRAVALLVRRQLVQHAKMVADGAASRNCGVEDERAEDAQIMDSLQEMLVNLSLQPRQNSLP